MKEKEKMKIEVMSIFPTPVVKVNINRSFTKDEIDCISNISMMEKSEVKSANRQSEDSYLFDNFTNERLKEIKIFCEYELKQYLEHIEGVDTDFAGLRITQSWLNKNKPQEQHLLHFHQNSYLSAVLYIKCLPNDGINFVNRSFGLYNNIEFPKKKVTKWNSSGFKQNVTEGDLIIFPSWIMHFVNVNETENKERISLAFNTFPIGELGNKNGASHLKL
tara:strand:- start:50 stop:706 length:657 start_codon:yes stop_codon:yes gene_type:complete